jgi:hypothetical protein
MVFDPDGMDFSVARIRFSTLNGAKNRNIKGVGK